jgi:hypothetical protein
MLVVTLSSFVVEAEHAYLVNDECQSVLEAVRAARHRALQLPDHNIGEPALADDSPFTK